MRLETEFFASGFGSMADERRTLVADTEPWCDLSNLSDGELARRVRLRGAADRLWNETNYGGAGMAQERSDGEPEAEAEDLVEKHDVFFEVLDANGEPFAGHPYVLIGPDGEAEDGELPANGRVDRKNVVSEDYKLRLRQIRDACWGGETACALVQIPLSAAVHGYADGTEVEIRLFRQYAESDDAVLETLSASVSRGRVSATWTYEHDPEGPFATEHDIVELVAEFRVGSDGPWAKTPVPLRLQLPTVDNADWVEDEAAPGEEVTLSLTAVGVPEGTPLAIQIFKCRRSGEELLVGEIEDLQVVGEQVTATWAYPEAEDPDAPPIEAECYFIATLDGDPNRITVSDMLTVSTATEDEDGDDD